MNIELLKRRLQERHTEAYQGYKIACGLINLLDDSNEDGALTAELRWACALETIFDFLASDLAHLLSDLNKTGLEIETHEPVSAGTITKHLDKRSN